MLTLSTDFGSAITSVANRRTLEVSPLPSPGDWSIAADDDGFVAFADETSQHDPIMAEEFLRRQVFKTGAGEYIVVEATAKGSQTWSLSARLLEHQPVTVRWQVGQVRASISWPVGFLRWPRSGCFIFWSLSHAYTALGLASFRGAKSKWAYEGAQSWEAYFSSLAPGHNHFVHSRLASNTSDTDGSNPSMLDWPAATTFGFVALFARWAVMKPRHVGLREPGAAEGSRALLLGVFLAALPCRPFAVRVQAAEDWSPPWPGDDGLPPGDTLNVKEDGTASVSAWADEADRPAANWIFQRWHQHLKKAGVLSSDGRCTVVHRILATLGDESCKALSVQLMCQLPQRIELSVLHCMQHGKSTTSGIEASADDLLRALHEPRRLDYEPFRRVLAMREVTKDVHSFSWSCDKANVGGL